MPEATDNQGMSFKFFPIFLFILCSLAIKVRADIYTPATLNMSAQELNGILNSSFKEGLILSSQLKELPQIKGLEFEAEDIQYTAKFVPFFEILEDGRVKLSVTVKDVAFKIINFDARYKLVQNSGSLRVNIFTRINCDSLVIQSARNVEIFALGDIKASRPWVTELDFERTPEFKVAAENCEAPENYEYKLTEIASKWLDSEEGKEQLKELVNNEVIGEYWDKFKKGLEFDLMGRKIYISLVKLYVEDVLQARVQIRWPYKDQILLNTQFPDSRGKLSYTISDLKKVLSLWIPQQCFRLTYTRSELASANDLFESRFMQFFAWRDLMSFPKDIDFKLHIALCVNQLSINHATKSGVKFDHNSILLVQLNLVQNGKELPYVVAHGAGRGQMTIESTEKGMGIKLEKNDFNLSSRFHSKMVEWRGAGKYSGAPSMSMIFPRVINALEASPIIVAKEFEPLLKNLNFTSGAGVLNFEK